LKQLKLLRISRLQPSDLLSLAVLSLGKELNGLFQSVEAVVELGEDLRVGLEGDLRAALLGAAGDVEIPGGLAALGALAGFVNHCPLFLRLSACFKLFQSSSNLSTQ